MGVFIVFSSLALAGAPPGIEWQKTIYTDSNDDLFEVMPTSDRGYIMVGHANSTSNDADLLIKTDLNGNIQWTKRFNKLKSEYGYNVDQTSDGGYVFLGKTDPYGTGNYYIWVVKTDSKGNIQWERSFGESDSSAEGTAVHQTFDGGYIVIGYIGIGSEGVKTWLIKLDSNGNYVWDKKITQGSFAMAMSGHQTSDGGYIIGGWTLTMLKGDCMLIKTNANGNVVWNKTYGGSGWDLCESTQQTSDGGYVLAGNTPSFGAGGRDFYVIKTDANGNSIWSETYGGSQNDWAYSVQQASDKGYILAGYTESFGAGGKDMWIVKTDLNGNKEWDIPLGGAYDDAAKSVKETPDMGYFVGGYKSTSTSSNVWMVKFKGLCYNGIRDGNEEGVDCGGSCPFVCGYCVPYIKNGDNGDKIDIVFIPDTSYNNDINLFLQHINDIIQNSFNSSPTPGGSTVIKDNLRKFNFYYIKEEGEIDWGNWEHKPPKNFFSECSFYDGGVMVHTDSHRDFASTSKKLFSSENYNYGTILHEFSHSLFDLADEYCCDSYYFQPKPYPNIWKNNNSCRQDAQNEGWDPDDCYRFCPKWMGNCGGLLNDGWWRSDPLPDIMEDDGDDIVPPFERADLRNVNWKFNQYPAQSYLKVSAPEDNASEGKIAVISLSFDDENINLTGLRVIYNKAPELLSQNGDLNLTAVNRDGTIADGFLFWDPRRISIENESVMLNESNTTIVIPLSFDEDYVSIYNSSNDLKIRIDLTPYFIDFCRFGDGVCDLDCEEFKDIDCVIESNITLLEGWNLISYPVETLNQTIESAYFFDYTDIYKYSSGWHHIDNKSDINISSGYWVYVLNNTNATISGFEIKNVTYSLKEGNNLISYPSVLPENISVLFSDVSEKINSIFIYRNNTWLSHNFNRTVNTLDIVNPGEGIWVNLKNDTTWVFDGVYR